MPRDLPGKVTNRAELARVVQALTGVSLASSHRLLDSVLDEIVSELAAGEPVKLHTFGTFRVRRKRERLARNPITLEKAIVTARKVVTFAPSRILLERLNSRP
jgi:integration host factor subunit alpha